jgi:cytosine deaminase
MAITEIDRRWLEKAFEQARLGLAEGGIPIGAVLVRDDRFVAGGHNKRVQQNDLTAHGEMDCLRAAGAQSLQGTTLYTSLSPCWMCTGTILQFGISRVIIGENINFVGKVRNGLDPEALLSVEGVEVAVANDPGWASTFRNWKDAHSDLWCADIGQ